MFKAWFVAHFTFFCFVFLSSSTPFRFGQHSTTGGVHKIKEIESNLGILQESWQKQAMGLDICQPGLNGGYGLGEVCIWCIGWDDVLH